MQQETRRLSVNDQPRPLTHDEKKAAEAAFQSLPFHPTWSEAARKVYDGIACAIARSNRNGLHQPQAEIDEDMWERVA